MPMQQRCLHFRNSFISEDMIYSQQHIRGARQAGTMMSCLWAIPLGTFWGRSATVNLSRCCTFLSKLTEFVSYTSDSPVGVKQSLCHNLTRIVYLKYCFSKLSSDKNFFIEHNEALILIFFFKFFTRFWKVFSGEFLVHLEHILTHTSSPMWVNDGEHSGSLGRV